MLNTETIAAISTAVQEAGIGIIRISGPQAFEVADRIFRPAGHEEKLSKAQTHTIHYGFIEENGMVIDEVLVSVMRAPRSYTAEDTVEINCHGGVTALMRVLRLVTENGARPAEPGEFTKRAFLNGRIDLSRAEAVMEVIRSGSDLALETSVKALRGSIQKEITALRGSILHELARIESALDDPEHYSLDGYPEQLAGMIEKWNAQINRLIRSYEEGRMIRSGIRTAIIGRPNAGKSSLLNALLGEERAIVTQIAGTTRDVVSEKIRLGGILLTLADTAGIRETGDQIEQIGVERARKEAKEADLILAVFDSTVPLSGQEEQIFSLLKGKKALLLLNKTDRKEHSEEQTSEEDLRKAAPDIQVISISAKYGTGLDELEEAIRKMFLEDVQDQSQMTVITNERHRNCLQRAAQALGRTLESIEMQMPEDFFSIDLTESAAALGEITGEDIKEDLVDEIFRSFCMGK